MDEPSVSVGTIPLESPDKIFTIGRSALDGSNADNFWIQNVPYIWTLAIRP